jgi:hypothetical protein
VPLARKRDDTSLTHVGRIRPCGVPPETICVVAYVRGRVGSLGVPQAVAAVGKEWPRGEQG